MGDSSWRRRGQRWRRKREHGAPYMRELKQRERQRAREKGRRGSRFEEGPKGIRLSGRQRRGEVWTKGGLPAGGQAMRGPLWEDKERSGRWRDGEMGGEESRTGRESCGVAVIAIVVVVVVVVVVAAV